jgi:hypothetical protein
MESAMLAFLASAIGAAFAWWSAPFVAGRINPPDNPARLFFPWIGAFWHSALPSLSPSPACSA